nr:putative reverse transcriptase domain-containing protein [Tanacetum cinerariifolium]
MKVTEEEYWKNIGKKSKILTNTDVKVDGGVHAGMVGSLHPTPVTTFLFLFPHSTVVAFKANVVADALNRKSGMIAGIKVEKEIIHDLERLDIELYVRGQHGYWDSLRVEPDLISQIKEAQKEDNKIWTIVENLDEQTE